MSQVRFVDVGCGFGGLLIRLAPLYPEKLMLGFELRDKVGSPGSDWLPHYHCAMYWALFLAPLAR